MMMTIIQILSPDLKKKINVAVLHAQQSNYLLRNQYGHPNSQSSLLSQPSHTQSDENYTTAAAETPPAAMQNPSWEYPTTEELLWQYFWIIPVYSLTSYSVGDNNTHDLVKQPHIKWDIPATLRNFSPSLLWEIRKGRSQK